MVDVRLVGSPAQLASENARRLSRVEKAVEKCPLGIEEFAEQQHSELIVEQTNTGSLGEQYRKFPEE